MGVLCKFCLDKFSNSYKICKLAVKCIKIMAAKNLLSKIHVKVI